MILRRAFLPERLSMRGTPAGRNPMGSGRGSCPSAPEAGSIPVFMVRMVNRKVVEEKGIEC
jgi:hypothetical protein